MNTAFLLISKMLLVVSGTQVTEKFEESSPSGINCRDRNRLLNSDDNDLYKVVEGKVGRRLILQCHYCNENDDEQPKIWYKYNHNFTIQEVDLGMDPKMKFNRLRINEAHSLIFQNVQMDDFGFYFCQGMEQQEAENRFNYLVDVTYDNGHSPEKGNISTWRTYHDDYITPINKILSNVDSKEHHELQRRFLDEINIELFTEWDDTWGFCEVCGRPPGGGIRRKNGACRLMINKEKHFNTSGFFGTYRSWDEAIFFKAQRLSCRSLLVHRLLPEISKIIRTLPDFTQVEPCQGVCNPDAEGLGKGWKTGKTYGFKYKMKYVLAQGAHLTLVCPESTFENQVKWKQNGKSLKPGGMKGQEEPKIVVDSFFTLYLREVTSAEEGNYTCEVDGVKMQQIMIYVVSKSRLLTQAFLRHMLYLGFVLSLTLSCYCCGLFITWTKRHNFKSYEELVEEEEKSKNKDWVTGIP